MSLVSIIIPNYNNAKWLSACIRSCLNQSGNFKKEIIVVDDHSTDDSWQVLQHFQATYPEEVFIYKNLDKGGNQARNFGFAKAHGDYIQWLDSDDLLLPEKLGAQINFLERNTEIDIVYSDWRMDFYEREEKIKEETVYSKEQVSFLKALIKDKWLPNNSYLLRKSIAQKLNLEKAWNPERKVAQDREYFTIAAILGAHFDYVPGVFSVYNRWSEQSVSSMHFKARLALNQALESKLINLIEGQEVINPLMKRELISILKTDGLKACYYYPKLRINRPISFFEIQWRHIHYKMRFVIPFVWVFQMTLYYMRVISKP